ncbi:type I-F CRISPR-associated endoribonuclease Cas6/Csy4 [Vibrio parahaemolyticus]|uniref:Type I-F CRISPR-associated endoribonuclease Cas6/Csy4 n=1 Tax=Vibrio parahaemolyticus TaxID=670 RepID=A0A7Z2MQH7_VIBPH|nr:type I-F CRISPR-associated endoribonuclease Cas6/Csy4 [Vibrio parahaemolyticus]MCR9724625.1 type I-F CRISPR-associated endoribonuclease Cas6/Csy4 [Vibrio parahaemolyticus]MCR9743475.1 type I-F CRISPR-associated endoribonuclease Cas6/Csy4 [Vibrio parahaemolyticus]QHH08795.1 type I-F CRISPR-associated endoribonuclease Cas6/Csy4 [Vibrio parahaemolyticus]UJX09404.1 type I-F CRISPR-associated endoribonuclease Cas6/Csy4 [Vibrio parahaemolyticus]HAS6673255.1 type I-F CRISPR-associated endoribonucl
MTKRYYFCIRYTPVQADYELLAGRCISQMHLFMVNNRQSINKIGVSFPDWSDVTVGQTIAFVAEDKEMMIGLSFQPYFSMMVNEGLFEISNVFEVPDNAIEVRFTRNQTIGKSFLGSKKRRIKRSMARAELLDVGTSLPVTNEERIVDSFHRIPISSGSSGEDYILFVQKEFVSERGAVNFNSYGLATNQERKGTVPELRF